MFHTFIEITFEIAAIKTIILILFRYKIIRTFDFEKILQKVIVVKKKTITFAAY
jgi:hypothetical protein